MVLLALDLHGGCTLLDELSEGCEVSIYVYSKKLVAKPKVKKFRKKMKVLKNANLYLDTWMF